MDIDLPATISAVTLLVSFISPIVVTVINNRHAERLARMKDVDNLRTQAIVNYIRNTGPVIYSPSDELYDKYRSSYGEIFLHVSSELWDDITLLDDLIHDIILSPESVFRAQASNIFSELCKSLSRELSRKENKQRRRKAK